MYTKGLFLPIIFTSEHFSKQDADQAARSLHRWAQAAHSKRQMLTFDGVWRLLRCSPPRSWFSLCWGDGGQRVWRCVERPMVAARLWYVHAYVIANEQGSRGPFLRPPSTTISSCCKDRAENALLPEAHPCKIRTLKWLDE